HFQDGSSCYNDVELQVVASLLRTIPPTFSVLVVSPYAAQVRRLIDLAKGFAAEDDRISARTIDGCQGRQADIVIVSFVRLDFKSPKEFIAEPRRLNVALSRARERLYLVGNRRDLLDSLGRASDLPHMQGLSALSADPDVVSIQSASVYTTC